MTAENPMRLVRELKGAPLSIYLVLGLAGQRVSQAFLERWTGYTDKPVSQALAFLEEIGLAQHSRRGWALCDGVKQLQLGIEDSLAHPDPEEEEEEPAVEVEPELPPIPEAEGFFMNDLIETSRKYSDSLITTTTTINPLINLSNISSSS